MKIGISQPTFMPWQGYFWLINNVDEFIFLDDVQFDKRSWQQRNKISLEKKDFFLTVPVKSKNKYNQKINEVLIDRSSDYIKKHLLTLKHAYKHSVYFEKYYREICKIYDHNFEKLNELNLALIKFFLSILNIKTKVSFSSKLKINSKKEELIKDICLKKKCTSYISTIGAKNYLSCLEKYNLPFVIKYYNIKNNNNLEINNKLSIIDLIFNFGEESTDIINKSFGIEI